jgi:uncharacterized membrane protein YeaQ/YmgE (transglycosylase-associated protein family)
MESGLGIISWIIFGALAGWVASLIAGTNREQSWLENIIVGIIGAFLGGFLFSLLTGRATYFAWNVGSFVFVADAASGWVIWRAGATLWRFARFPKRACLAA